MATPQQKSVAHVLFAQWLYENYPEVFAQIAQATKSQGVPKLSGLGDFSDILSSIGDSIGSTASDIADGLSTTVQTVGNVLQTPGGQAVLKTVMQANAGISPVVMSQYGLAQNGKPLAPIQTVYNPATGSYVPVNSYTGAPITSSMLGGNMSQYMLPIAIGAGALLLIVALR